MSSVEVGTAKIVLTGDTSGLEVAIDRAKQKQMGLGAAAEAEANKMTAAQRKVIRSLDEQITKMGLDYQQRLQLKVIMSTEGAARDALLAKIKANSAALNTENKSLEEQGREYKKLVNERNKYGLTGKQEAAALRQVPAQLTDIFVSLQGGQNPMTVLLQQGGQLRDVFGGIRPVLTALGSQLLSLVTPITAVAAAAAAVAYSFVNASSEQTKFAVALAQSGSQADLNSEKLARMAVALSDMDGVSRSSATETLAQVTSAGRFTAEQIMQVATAAEQMRVSTGQSVDDTIAAFVRISKDPVAAILELNESQHFLTQSTYEQIKSLQEQGDMAGAAQVAMDAYAGRIQNVTRTVDENIGYLQQFAKTLKGLFADISDAVLSIGRATTNADKVRQSQEKINDLIRARDRMRSGSFFQGGVYGGLSEAGYASAIARQRAEIAKLTMFDNVRGTQAANVVTSEAQKQLDAINAGNRGREDRQKLEERQIVNLYKQQGIMESDKRVQDALLASRKAYDESKPKGRSGEAQARSLANAEASLDITRIKAVEDERRNEIANSTKLLQAEYSARNITTEDYYSKQRELIQQDAQAQENSILQQIAYLKQRDVAGKDAVNVMRQIEQLEQKLAKVRADSATAATILGIQEKELADKRREAFADYQYGLDRNVESIKKQVDAQITAIMYGEREAEKQSKLTEIYDKQTEALRRLLLQKERGEISPEEYGQRVAAENANAQASADAVIDGYKRMEEAQGSWLNGLRSGVADWITQTQNVAGQINQLTRNALDGTVDALTTLFTTGKNTFRELLADLGKQLVRFFAQRAVMQLLQMFFPGGTGGWGQGGGGDVMTPRSTGPFYANGAAFLDAPGLSAYSGSVVNRPTPFMFARGGGVMGEAGPEAIMPLKRGSDGKLGVQMYGGGSSQVSVNIVTNIENGNAQSSSDSNNADNFKAFSETMQSMVTRGIQKSMLPGGELYAAGVRN